MTDNKSLTQQLNSMGIEPVVFRSLQDMQPAADRSSLMMMLRYCQASKLDPLRQPVTVIPIDGRQVPVITINGLRAHASRTGCYAGSRCEFADTIEDVDGIRFPSWAKCIVQRIMPDGSRAEFEGLVFAVEVVGRTKAGKVTRIWRQRSMHMLQIAAERLALRRAFPESVPAKDAAPATHQIDPNTGEIHGQAPEHLSDEDIAAGLERIELAGADEADADWIEAYDSSDR